MTRAVTDQREFHEIGVPTSGPLKIVSFRDAEG